MSKIQLLVLVLPMLSLVPSVSAVSYDENGVRENIDVSNLYIEKEKGEGHGLDQIKTRYDAKFPREDEAGMAVLFDISTENPVRISPERSNFPELTLELESVSGSDKKFDYAFTTGDVGVGETDPVNGYVDEQTEGDLTPWIESMERVYEDDNRYIYAGLCREPDGSNPGQGFVLGATEIPDYDNTLMFDRNLQDICGIVDSRTGYSADSHYPKDGPSGSSTPYGIGITEKIKNKKVNLDAGLPVRFRAGGENDITLVTEGNERDVRINFDGSLGGVIITDSDSTPQEKRGFLLDKGEEKRLFNDYFLKYIGGKVYEITEDENPESFESRRVETFTDRSLSSENWRWRIQIDDGKESQNLQVVQQGKIKQYANSEQYQTQSFKLKRKSNTMLEINEGRDCDQMFDTKEFEGKTAVVTNDICVDRVVYDDRYILDRNRNWRAAFLILDNSKVQDLDVGSTETYNSGKLTVSRLEGVRNKKFDIFYLGDGKFFAERRESLPDSIDRRSTTRKNKNYRFKLEEGGSKTLDSTRLVLESRQKSEAEVRLETVRRPDASIDFGKSAYGTSEIIEANYQATQSGKYRVEIIGPGLERTRTYSNREEAVIDLPNPGPGDIEAKVVAPGNTWNPLDNDKVIDTSQSTIEETQTEEGQDSQDGEKREPPGELSSGEKTGAGFQWREYDRDPLVEHCQNVYPQTEFTGAGIERSSMSVERAYFDIRCNTPKGHIPYGTVQVELNKKLDVTGTSSTLQAKTLLNEAVKPWSFKGINGEDYTSDGEEGLKAGIKPLRLEVRDDGEWVTEEIVFACDKFCPNREAHASYTDAAVSEDGKKYALGFQGKKGYNEPFLVSLHEGNRIIDLYSSETGTTYYSEIAVGNNGEIGAIVGPKGFYNLDGGEWILEASEGEGYSETMYSVDIANDQPLGLMAGQGGEGYKYNDGWKKVSFPTDQTINKVEVSQSGEYVWLITGSEILLGTPLSQENLGKRRSNGDEQEESNPEISLSTSEITRGETLEIAVNNLGGRQLEVENPEGETVENYDLGSSAQVEYQAPEDAQTGEYTLRVLPKTNGLTGILDNLIGSLVSSRQTSTFVIEQTSTRWLDYCSDNGYDVEAKGKRIEQKVSCIKREIVPSYFEDTIGEDVEVARSLCDDLSLGSYNQDIRACEVS